MTWYHDLQFIAAVAMPDELAEAYGTTINGMWAAAEFLSDQYLESAHAKGNRVLFSVPLIALTPKFYAPEEDRYLIDEACRDIDGNTSLVPWYYWESLPVYSLCFYSSKFRNYLLERCRKGIERGFDVVNLDEIQTNLGLMNQKPGSSGFCSRCLDRFRKHIPEMTGLDSALADLDDDTLRQKLREDETLYERYRAFHEMEAYQVVVEFIQELRMIAQEVNPNFAITANMGYLGNLVPVNGNLWGLMWGSLIDFVMMENDYKPVSSTHLLLPRGKFTAWYKLGSAISRDAPVWICPSINVPKQMAGEKRLEYYTLMFLEAYANNGRWGYYWWPGVDVETRVKTTAPEKIKSYTRLFQQYRRYFEQVSTQNSLAILYLNSSMLAQPEEHFKYVALAQALSEAGFQYDVVYSGDGVFEKDALDLERLCQYKAVLVPGTSRITPVQKEVLSRYAATPGCQLIPFGHDSACLGIPNEVAQDEMMLYRYWKEYQDTDRQRIAECAVPYSAAIYTSNPLVNAIRYKKGSETILHLLNYNYGEANDEIQPVENLSVRVPWEGSHSPVLRWITLNGEEQYPCQYEDGLLKFEIPKLDLYGLAVVL